MRIEVTRRFRDMDALTNPDRTGDEDPVHEIGATLTVTKERGEELVSRGFATEIPSPAPTSAKPAKPARKPAARKPAPVTPPPAPVPAGPIDPPAAADPAFTPAPAGN